MTARKKASPAGRPSIRPSGGARPPARATVVPPSHNVGNSLPGSAFAPRMGFVLKSAERWHFSFAKAATNVVPHGSVYPVARLPRIVADQLPRDRNDVTHDRGCVGGAAGY